MKKTHFAVGVLSLAILSSCTKNANESAEMQSDLQTEMSASSTSSRMMGQTSGEQVVPNQVLVKFKAGTSEAARTKAFEKISANVLERIVTKAMQRFGDNEGFYLLNTPLNALDAISKVKGVEIEFAEPNYIYNHQVTSNDTYFTNGSLWGMYGDGSSPANQYGSQAAEAWANSKTGNDGVFIGIIDEGAMFTHEDLASNFWTNPYDPVDGIDNDGNGYKDDVHGWDFAGNDNTTFDGGSDDHGTHVAGTIGAAGGNGKGVAGVNWNVTMISAKFLGRNGGTTANAVKAVDYITDLKTRHGLNIPGTNNSWGGGGFSQALKDAISRANAQNILFVAAAGNNGTDNDATASYPSNYDVANVIAVAAIDKNGALASFSQYGKTTVDLGAPGVSVYSTLPNKSGSASSYGSYSGTSMATPHVTGAVALYAAAHPGSTAAQIKSAILDSTVPTASLNGKCVTGGRLNVSGF